MAWLIIPRSVSIVPNRSSSSVSTQRLGIDRTTSWSQVRSVVGKAEPVRGLIRPPGAVMGQHPRTWFSSTTAGFQRADAAWLLASDLLPRNSSQDLIQQKFELRSCTAVITHKTI